MAKRPGADYHRMAAEHHEKAAYHHKRAAEYYEAGNVEKALIQAKLAAVYLQHAVDHVQNQQDEPQLEHHEQYYS